MKVRKSTGLIIVLFLTGAVLTAFYFYYWQEPTATYVKTDNPKLIEVRKDLEDVKASLREEGKYNCCIANDCNWCALYMGHCPCAEMVSEKGNEKSCPECAAAWNRKQGKVAGVDPDAVKVTTFGVYGFEGDGHHSPDSAEDNVNH